MAEIVERSKIAPKSRVSPVDVEIAKLDGEYYKLKEAAEMVGVSDRTLRRLIASKKLDIPKDVLVMGQVTVYLFTPEEIEQLKEYYHERRAI